MNACTKITKPKLREELKILCKDKKFFNSNQLYETLQLNKNKDKERINNMLNNMTKHGELIHISTNVYEYNFKFRVRENATYPKIWRYIRMEKANWSYTDISQLTNISCTQIARYCSWLEDEGYIARKGKKGVMKLFRTTRKADQIPETPYPPSKISSPFNKENIAAAKIVRLLLCHDPLSPKVAREIVEACDIIRAKFNKSFKQIENGGS